MSWGRGPNGVTPWGSGSPVRRISPTPPVTYVNLVFAEAIRENVIEITFDEPMYFSRWADPGDASDVANYLVTNVLTSFDIYGNLARPVTAIAVQLPPGGDGTKIDIWLDRAMSHTGAQYDVLVHNLISVAGNPLPPDGAIFRVSGVQQGLSPTIANEIVSGRDLVSPSNILSLVDDTGDVGMDHGLVAYKKRVFRRLTTRKNAFRNLPGYGVSIPDSVKKLMRANIVGGISADAENQIRQEPETKSVTVTLVPSTNTPGLVVYRVSVTTNLGNFSDFDVPVPI